MPLLRFQLPSLPSINWSAIANSIKQNVLVPFADFIVDFWHFTKNVFGSYGFPQGVMAPQPMKKERGWVQYIIGCIVLSPVAVITNLIVVPLANSWQTLGHLTRQGLDFYLDNPSKPSDDRNGARKWFFGFPGLALAAVVHVFILFPVGLVYQGWKTMVEMVGQFSHAALSLGGAAPALEKRAAGRRYGLGIVGIGVGAILCVGIAGLSVLQNTWSSMVEMTLAFSNLVLERNDVISGRRGWQRGVGVLGYVLGIFPCAVVGVLGFVYEGWKTMVEMVGQFSHAALSLGGAAPVLEKRAAGRRYGLGIVGIGVGAILCVGIAGLSVLQNTWSSMVEMTLAFSNLVLERNDVVSGRQGWQRGVAGLPH